MIRKATSEDLTYIMAIVKRVVTVMNRQGSYQWDDSYPQVKDYQKDIDRGELYVFETNSTLVGVCTISNRGHEEYHLIAWTPHHKFFTLKRLAIDPSARGKGIADQFFTYAEQLALKNNVTLINTDTFSENHYAQQLFKRNGYQFVQTRKENEHAPKLAYFEKIIE
ncbi:Acetyltransferase (GNAT) family protein [Paraliobacillus sp. PM-2]|uniref:GNAT family N-acetyltransferase n=1 Tax=Paraliobacillus sp. PM-2 TaxID=1462524 RepID=UPI00061BD4C7|nr:GNAT family N-acetyltransferase [Paraliobacillus sp. PM-2]CQR48280.1 Acetyltransferase (GNAT) family protein [Paraliobacillus sp. PM-2]